MRNRLTYSHCQKYWTDQYLNHLVLTTCCNLTSDLYLQALHLWEESERRFRASQTLLGRVGPPSPPRERVCFRGRSPEPQWDIQRHYPCPWSFREAHPAPCQCKKRLIHWQDLLLWSEDRHCARGVGVDPRTGAGCCLEQRVRHSLHIQCI